ncbi:SIR2 family NAD-dependent protein deacylase [Macrococcus epidermidis]|uniref:SIR2 family NAD-dependent protein deacylase n=1 Tax=Macrococcus epidermidis TaxID=1902580 RepID=UPI0020B6C274|nr:Sir2 silent information regulator family NAD-dependent deacetylase [Macrococcus epidermidis]UTH15086.1 Sir2 silent information regulator family NAD-dependent deacetylase [Macrococcus epidermidis]
MKNYYNQKDGYRETIQQGLNGIKYFNKGISNGAGSKEEQLTRLKNEIKDADAVLIGAGAGLSISAGLTYHGERFEKYFFDFIEKYRINDLYSGGFYPFPDNETKWAWWARHIYFNRYINPPKPVYENLFSLLKNTNYFIITTNVDHQFQRAGFNKQNLFYTQGDYGLFQSVNPEIKKTYDNELWVMRAMETQGFIKDENGIYTVPDNNEIAMQIPTMLIPKCPDDHSDMTTNLRVDDTFVEDEGWHKASCAYYDFLQANKDKRILFLELGIGANTPVIIKYPFWEMTLKNENAMYACINYGEAFCPIEIENQSVCIDADIGGILERIM